MMDPDSGRDLPISLDIGVSSSMVVPLSMETGDEVIFILYLLFIIYYYLLYILYLLLIIFYLLYIYFYFYFKLLPPCFRKHITFLK